MPVTARQFAEGMRRKPLEMRAKAAQVVVQTALVAESGVRLNLSGRVLQRRSGDLIRTVKTSLRGSGAQTVVTLTVGSREAPYAEAHEKGAKIRPKNGPYLHFKGGKGWVRVKEVTLPARPFLAPAAAEGQKFMERRLAVVVADVLKGDA